MSGVATAVTVAGVAASAGLAISNAVGGSGGMPSIPIPKAPAAPPPAAAPATMADSQVAAAGAGQKSAAAAAATANGTIGTSPAGLTTPPPTAQATLLGGTK